VRDLAERDQRDRSREHSPLAPAPGAVVADTTASTVDEIVERLVAVVARPGAGSTRT
jgi:cytidylate kinase